MAFLPEQFSAGTRQLDAQIDFMRAMTAQAFCTAEQVLALNISTSRATVERAASTVRQLCSITDPRDLLALGTQTQEQLSAMYAYGRELMNIATDARASLARHTAALPSPAPEQPAGQREPAPAAGQAGQAPRAEPSQAAAGVVAGADEPAAPPPAKAKPLAKAVGKATGKRAGAPHPAAAPLEAAREGKVALPRLDPADVAPVLELKAPKSQRKK